MNQHDRPRVHRFDHGNHLHPVGVCGKPVCAKQAGDRDQDEGDEPHRLREVPTEAVPVLAGGEDLDKAYTPLDQPAGDQTTCPVILRFFPVQAVCFFDRFRLTPEVEGLLRRILHPRREPVTRETRFQLTFARVPLEVFAVKPLQ